MSKEKLPEIEVTPEMVEAGIIFWGELGWNERLGYAVSPETVKASYLAMYAHAPELKITSEMIAAAEAVIEDSLAYSTSAAAIDAEVVLREALRARSASEQTKEPV